MMTKRPAPRFSIEELIDFEHVTNGEVAARLGVARNTVVRYKTSGLSAKQADDLARRVDRHAGEVWPDYYDDIDDDLDLDELLKGLKPCT